MGWNLEGLEVTARYLEEFPVQGLVVQSRVALGGRVLHTILLDAPIRVYGAVRERVILEHTQVEQVRSHHGTI